MRLINYFLGDKYPEKGTERKRTRAFVVIHLFVFVLLLAYASFRMMEGKFAIVTISAMSLMVLDLILIRKGGAKLAGHILTSVLSLLIASKIALNFNNQIPFSVFTDTFYILPVLILTTALFSNRAFLFINTTLLFSAVIYTYVTNINLYPEALKPFASNGILIYFVDMTIVFMISLLFSKYMKEAIEAAEENLNKQEEQTLALSEIISNVKQNAGEVALINQSYKRTAEQVMKGAVEQSAATQQAFVSAEAMATSIAESSESGGQAENLARKSVTTMHKSSKAVEQTVKKLYEIIEKTAYINNFAVKTNILALNAAIEAKQAGEYGAGFAAIAKEVRKLAENSRLAADEIKTLVSQGRDTAESSINMLNSAIPDVTGTLDIIQNIAESGRKQNITAGQINNIIEKLTAVSEKNKNLAEELSQNYKKLNFLTELLNKNVARELKKK